MKPQEQPCADPVQVVDKPSQNSTHLDVVVRRMVRGDGGHPETREAQGAGARRTLTIAVIPRTPWLLPPPLFLPLPLPGDLPTSLSFRSRPGEPWALEPVYAPGFRDKAARSDMAREFVRSRGGQCEGCGLRRGSVYRAELYDTQGRLVWAECRVSRGGQAAHRGNDPSRCRPEDLICLCPICHGHADAVHRWSAAALTRAADPLGTRLTRVSRDQWLSRGREAVRQGGLPALGVGGVDLLVAHGLDLGLPTTPAAMRCLVPELTRAPDAGLRAVIVAASVRLRMRGLLAEGQDRLRRPLCLPTAVTETPPDPRRLGG